MGWSRPRLQACQLSTRIGRPEGLAELSAVKVWALPMTDQGPYSYYTIVTDFGQPGPIQRLSTPLLPHPVNLFVKCHLAV